MRRTDPNPKKNSTHKSHSRVEFDAPRLIQELQRRVSKLEQTVEGILETPHVSELLPKADRKRPGPKPVHIWSVCSNRDQLVNMLEDYWPELEPLCKSHPDATALKELL